MKFNHLKLNFVIFRFLSVILFILTVLWLYSPYKNTTYYENLIFWIWILGLSSLIWLLPRKTILVYEFFVVIFLTLDFWFQTVYFRAFGQYGRVINLIGNTSELLNSFDSIKEFFIIDDLRYLYIGLSYLTLSFLLVLMTSKSKRKQLVITVPVFLIQVSAIVFLIYQFNVTLEEDKNSIDGFQYYKTIHYIYTTVPNTLSFVENFGVLGLLEKDIDEIWISPISNNVSAENERITQLLLNKSTFESSDFTGTLKDKSLLVIESESLMELAINPVLTPTLYRISQQGYNFTNYNSPLLSGSTSDTELMANTSLLPVTTGENTFMNYSQNVYPVTLAKIFTENGYSVLAAHNNYAEFYNRGNMLPALGYDFFDSYRMGFEGNEIADSEFLSKLKWMSFGEDKFLNYWVTFSGHQPYSFDTLDSLFIENYYFVEQIYPNLPESEKSYLAKIMDFDHALGSLITDYTNSGKIDDLVIVIFGDHFAKGVFNSEETIEMVCDNSSNSCTRTPFIIWNNDQFVGNNDKISNPLDILPTLLDLFGLEYQTDFVLGRSVFDSSYTGFYFNDYGDWKFHDFSYNEISNEYINTKSISDEEIQKQLDAAHELISTGSLIIENDYFASQECELNFGECH